jgi:hypothetical protein
MNLRGRVVRFSALPPRNNILVLSGYEFASLLKLAILLSGVALWDNHPRSKGVGSGGAGGRSG